ncbi:hypothetical protein HanIR_Chr13g0669571 [Helianthus annuus]|nr:hypothetical protein HanIR_Chr13g0669571 [Helianthus annuus]
MFFKIITGTTWLLTAPDSGQGGSGVVTGRWWLVMLWGVGGGKWWCWGFARESERAPWWKKNPVYVCVCELFFIF